MKATKAGLSFLFATTAIIAVAQPTIIGVNGAAGYIDMPSALMPDEGEVNFSYYSSDLMSGRRLQLQPSENLSIGLEFSTDASEIEDQSLDIKYKLYQGDGYIPTVSVGANDVFGLGPRSSEYLVATSQITKDIEVSAGLGFGALGGYEPLSDNDNRPAIDPHAFSTDHFFSGPMAGFAGANWRTPIKGLSLSAEYSSLAWDDAVANGFERGAISYGAQYRPNDLFALSAYSRNGDDIGFSITISGNPNKPLTSSPSKTTGATIVPRAALGADMSTSWAANPAVRQAVGGQIATVLKDQDYKVNAVKVTANEISIELVDGGTRLTPNHFGRINRMLSAIAPGSVENFSIIMVTGDNIATSQTTVTRSDLERQAGRFDAPTQSFAQASITGAQRISGDDTFSVDNFKAFTYMPGVKIVDIYMDGKAARSISPNVSTKYKTRFGLSANAKLSFNLLGDDEFPLDPSDIGNAVRSDDALYRRDAVSLDRLSADYKFKLGRDVYGRFAAGLLDTQYAGVDAEVLYAPSGSRFAVGAEIAQVTKRSPDAMFELLEYQTTTGQVTGYWDTGYKGYELSAGYGRFLAEDWGTTLGVTRKFASGWEMSGSITATEHFFDSQDTRHLSPTFSVKVPIDWAISGISRAAPSIDFASSNTDAGQSLGYGESLYSDVRSYDLSDYELRWGGYWQ